MKRSKSAKELSAVQRPKSAGQLTRSSSQKKIRAGKEEETKTSKISSPWQKSKTDRMMSTYMY